MDFVFATDVNASLSPCVCCGVAMEQKNNEGVYECANCVVERYVNTLWASLRAELNHMTQEERTRQEVALDVAAWHC